MPSRRGSGPSPGDVRLDERQLRVERQVVEVDQGGPRITEPLAEVMRRAGHSSAAAASRYRHAADQLDSGIAGRLTRLAAEHCGRDTDSA